MALVGDSETAVLPFPRDFFIFFYFFLRPPALPHQRIRMSATAGTSIRAGLEGNAPNPGSLNYWIHAVLFCLTPKGKPFQMHPLEGLVLLISLQGALT